VSTKARANDTPQRSNQRPEDFIDTGSLTHPPAPCPGAAGQLSATGAEDTGGGTARAAASPPIPRKSRR
jgi:hypothetical protein